MDDLEEQVRALVHEQIPWLPLDMPADTDVVNGSGIYGDDVAELVGEFADRFGVRIDGYRWYHHTGPEGFNPLWWLWRPWWARKTYVPIRLSDLVESARRREWVIAYPPGEREG